MGDNNEKTLIWVIFRPEYREMIELCGRIPLPKVAEHYGIQPNTLYNRLHRVRDRLYQGQKEINQLRNLMKKYPSIRKLLTPKILKPTERDLEPELYEEEEEEK